MVKRFYTLVLGFVIAVSGTVAAGTGKIITLDLSKPVNPSAFVLDEEKGYWQETYDDENYPYLQFNTFSFSHISSGKGLGQYWDGFTYCTNGDDANYGESGDSQAWIDNQWGCMAGGGIKTDADGNIMKNADGSVQVEAGIPYLVAYWGFFMESKGQRSLRTVLSGDTVYEAIGMYVCNHPWPYYGIMYGDGFSRPFDEGDHFKLIIHGLDKDLKETGKTVEHTLAEYKKELVESDKWEWIDLSPLGEVGGFYYTLETTDFDPKYGPNTSTYFCMDKLQVRDLKGDTGIKENYDISVAVYPNPFTSFINVTSQSDGIVNIYDIQGRLVLSSDIRSGENHIDASAISKGSYILHCGDTVVKMVK